MRDGLTRSIPDEGKLGAISSSRACLLPRFMLPSYSIRVRFAGRAVTPEPGLEPAALALRLAALAAASFGSESSSASPSAFYHRRS